MPTNITDATYDPIARVLTIRGSGLADFDIGSALHLWTGAAAELDHGPSFSYPLTDPAPDASRRGVWRLDGAAPNDDSIELALALDVQADGVAAVSLFDGASEVGYCLADFGGGFPVGNAWWGSYSDPIAQTPGRLTRSVPADLSLDSRVTVSGGSLHMQIRDRLDADGRLHLPAGMPLAVGDALAVDGIGRAVIGAVRLIGDGGGEVGVVLDDSVAGVIYQRSRVVAVRLSRNPPAYPTSWRHDTAGTLEYTPTAADPQWPHPPRPVGEVAWRLVLPGGTPMRVGDDVVAIAAAGGAPGMPQGPFVVVSATRHRLGGLSSGEDRVDAILAGAS